MALSKYLARDKSTIDQMIPSRPAGSIDAADFLLIFDESDDKSKKATVTETVGSTAASSMSSGTEMLFQQSSMPSGWTIDASSKYDQAMIRVSVGNASLTSGGTANFTGAFGAKSSGGNITASPVSLTIGSTALTEANLPSHTHESTWRIDDGNPYTPGGPLAPYIPSAITNSQTNNVTDSSTHGQIFTSTRNVEVYTGISPGSGSTHSHPSPALTHNHTSNFTGSAISGLDLKYTDVLVGTKD